MIKNLLIALSILFLFSDISFANDSFLEALKEGKPYIDLRLRYEHVEADGFEKNANASTARTRLGYNSGDWNKFKSVVEVENVVYLGSDHYNDTVNGRSDYPSVADPENTQINQAYLKFKGISDTSINMGRQVIVLDGSRFVGDVGWRQNNQVFDALYIMNNSFFDTTLTYGYIYNVNRIFGEQSAVGDWRSDSHIMNIAYNGCTLGVWTVYGYLLDFESDSPANSSETYGGSFSGKANLNKELAFKYYVEYANQSDYGDNTVDYTSNYFHIAPGFVWKKITAIAGYEILGSDDGHFAFRTPLATLHKWNGWSDQFLITPNSGLHDAYISFSYETSSSEDVEGLLKNVVLQYQYHDFSSEEGDLDYGTEWGISLKKTINDNIYIETKYADYNADGFSVDTQKLIFGVGFKY